MIQSMKPDARVNFAQKYAPTDETLAKAIISLADALAKGDSSKLADMLTAESKADLDGLLNTGGWEEGTEKIEAVRLVRLDDLTPGGPGGGSGGSGASTGAVLQLAVQDPNGAYLIGWEAVKVGDKWAFKGIDAPADVRRLASDFDGGAGDMSGSGSAAGAETAQVPAGAGDLMQQGAIAAFLLTEANKRIATAAGTTADPAAISAAASQFNLDPAQLESLAETGRNAVRTGAKLQDAIIVQCFGLLNGVASSTGKVTEDQVIQHIANVLGQPEMVIRNIVKGGSGSPSSPTPTNNRSPRGG